MSVERPLAELSDNQAASGSSPHGFKKTRRGKRGRGQRNKTVQPYHQPEAHQGRFETQQRGNCGKHAVNNLLGYELFTIEKLLACAVFLERADGRQHHTADQGFWSIDVIQRLLNMHGYELHRWTANDGRDLLKTRGRHLVQTPLEHGCSHWIGVMNTVDGACIYDSFNKTRPIQLTVANLRRKFAIDDAGATRKDCNVYTIQRIHAC
jgi:hypothetical protein